jgi:hypothetical protein
MTWLLAAYLAVSTAACMTVGAWMAWGLGLDVDMRARLSEYEVFREQVYPNSSLATPPSDLESVCTVYPPYAFPMFVGFFEPGGLLQGRAVIDVLSALAMVLIGGIGYRALAIHGQAWGLVGALAGSAVTVNWSVIGLGQFSLLCMGCVALQIRFLELGRPLPAGAWWALAMIKPQIGLAFALLFIFRNQWRGLLFGCSILGGLSLLALWWTRLSPVALAHHWIFRMNMRFAVTSSGFGPAAMAEWMGWNHRSMQYAALFLLAMVLSVLAWLRFRAVWMPGLLQLAAICSVLGRVAFYHGPYDQVMLFPLILASISSAHSSPGWRTCGAATAVALTLWIPQRIQRLVQIEEVLLPATWCLAAISVGVAALPRATSHGRTRLADS